MDIFSEQLKKYIPAVNERQTELFEVYCNMLLEWNEKFNLTAITERSEIITKHFADSVLPIDLIPENARCVDIGAGAGFPSVPIMIMRDDVSMLLIDSLNKRVTFLTELLSALGLNDRATVIHARAEEAGQCLLYREKYDIALSRAVSSVNALAEWSAPLIRVGGHALMYKGAFAKDELRDASNALGQMKLTARIYDYPAEWGARSVIVATKNAATPKQYPRKAGTAKKAPL